MKQRKKEWMRVKPLIDKMSFLRAGNKIILKKWFLTGEGDLQYVEASALFDLWFHPDQSEERWAHLLNDGQYSEYRWGDSKSRFDTYSKSINFIDGTFFSGLEHRLYYYFHGKGLNIDRSGMSEEEYNAELKIKFSGFMQGADWFFDEVNPSVNHTIFCCLQGWHEAFLLGYHDCEMLDWTVEWVEKILFNKDNYAIAHIDLAEKINEIFTDENICEEAKQKIAGLRQKHRGERIHGKS